MKNSISLDFFFSSVWQCYRSVMLKWWSSTKHFVHCFCRCLRSFYWMATGLWMLETGSGSQQVPSSTSSSGSTLLSHLARRQTKMVTTSSKIIIQTDQLKLSHVLHVFYEIIFPLLYLVESTFLFWRNSQPSISMSLGKLHAVFSRQQDALWVKTTHIPLYSMKWSAKRISRGWS